MRRWTTMNKAVLPGLRLELPLGSPACFGGPGGPWWFWWARNCSCSVIKLQHEHDLTKRALVFTREGGGLQAGGVSSSASLEDSGILLKQSFFPSTTQRRCLRVCDLRQHGFVPGTSLRPLKEMLSSTWPATWWEWETGPRLLISYFITLLQYCG